MEEKKTIEKNTVNKSISKIKSDKNLLNIISLGFLWSIFFVMQDKGFAYKNVKTFVILVTF